MLMLLNQLMYSVYLVLSKPLSRWYSSVIMMKWMFLFSTLALAPFCLQYMQYVPMFHRETVSQLYALLYLLFGATFVSVHAYSNGIETDSSHHGQHVQLRTAHHCFPQLQSPSDKIRFR